MIIVFGSINIDLVFRVEKLPEEGETVLTEGFSTVPGGKGANQAVAAARALGNEAAQVVMVGAVGRDAFAEPALEVLRLSGVGLAAIGRTHRPTGCAIISVDAAGRNQITVASGANLDASQAWISDDLLEPGNLLLLQNEVAAAENLALARRAAARGAAVILNAAPARPLPPSEWAGLLRALVVNEAEAAALAGAASLAALRRLAALLDTTVVATLGGDGAVSVAPDGTGFRIGALPIPEIVDTTAAGDCFVGALASALREGQPLDQALRFASVAGGLACTKAGAQTSAPGRLDILAHLKALPPALALAEASFSEEALT